MPEFPRKSVLEMQESANLSFYTQNWSEMSILSLTRTKSVENRQKFAENHLKNCSKLQKSSTEKDQTQKILNKSAQIPETISSLSQRSIQNPQNYSNGALSIWKRLKFVQNHRHWRRNVNYLEIRKKQENRRFLKEKIRRKSWNWANLGSSNLWRRNFLEKICEKLAPRSGTFSGTKNLTWRSTP